MSPTCAFCGEVLLHGYIGAGDNGFCNEECQEAYDTAQRAVLPPQSAETKIHDTLQSIKEDVLALTERIDEVDPLKSDKGLKTTMATLTREILQNELVVTWAPAKNYEVLVTVAQPGPPWIKAVMPIGLVVVKSEGDSYLTWGLMLCYEKYKSAWDAWNRSQT